MISRLSQSVDVTCKNMKSHLNISFMLVNMYYVVVQNTSVNTECRYIRSLANNIGKIDSKTRDVVILNINNSNSTKRNVDDMFGCIRQSIPDTFAVLTPELKQISDGKLRKSSLTIIVSDICDQVIDTYINDKIQLYITFFLHRPY